MNIHIQVSIVALFILFLLSRSVTANLVPAFARMESMLCARARCWSGGFGGQVLPRQLEVISKRK